MILQSSTQARSNSTFKTPNEHIRYVLVILTCAYSTCTPAHEHSPTPLPQATQGSRQKSVKYIAAPKTPHPDATTHRVAAVYEVVALRREAAQHAVLLLRRRGPAHPPPQPAAARPTRPEKQPSELRNIASDAFHRTDK